jgi:glycosyltransferase involved in cell wall biosynthesis
MTPSVSVIIPAYNSAATIGRAIASVLAQTLTPLEIIVVDDGSKDETARILSEQYPTINLIMQQNAGAARARNKGVEMARGDLVAFLDADDAWHPQKLALQVAAFRADNTIELLCTRCKHYQQSDWQEEILSNSELYSNAPVQHFTFNEVFVHPFLATPSVMLKREFFTALGGFDTGLETAEDVDLWLRAAHVGHCARLNLPVTLVITQKESLSTRTRVSPYDRHLFVIDRLCSTRLFSFFFRYWLLPQVKSDIYCKWGSTLLGIQRPQEAAQKLVLSFLNFPSLRAPYLFLKSVWRIAMEFFHKV